MPSPSNETLSVIAFLCWSWVALTKLVCQSIVAQNSFLSSETDTKITFCILLFKRINNKVSATAGTLNGQ